MLRALIQKYQRLALVPKGKSVEIDLSTRLLRHFRVTFLTKPDNRCYLRVGARGMLNAQFTFESKNGSVEIGDRAYIGSDTSIISRHRISIGNDVTMAWGITIYDHNSHSFDWAQRQKVVDHFYRTYGSSLCFDELDWSGVEDAPIVIEDRVWIGFGAVILKGVTIGRGAIVGACSVVTRDVEAYTIVAGNPARVVKTLEAPNV